MLNFDEQKYKNTFEGSSSAIQKVATSAQTANELGIIYARHNIIENTFDISALTSYVLVGLIPIKNFIQALQEEAELDKETARRVAYDIRSQIFAPVAKELAAMQPASHDTSHANIHPARGREGSRRAPASNGIHPNNIVNLRE